MQDVAGAEPLALGQSLLPGYRVLGHLGRGETLDVYDVWSEERWSRCVVKVLRPDHRDDATAGRQLVREGRLVQRLQHPHIVRGYATIVQPEPAVVLETLTGATLSHLLEQGRRRLPAAEVVFLGIHLCSALHYLHGRNVLHLDLKPANVVSERGLAKLLDFSIARPPGRGVKEEGTPAYMAPEQVAGGELTAATDAWGLGAVLYEALSGEAPFPGSEPLHYEQLERPLRPLPRRRPAALTELITACLAIEPVARPGLAAIWDCLHDLAPGEVR
jgi:serine/threonine protein kinase